MNNYTNLHLRENLMTRLVNALQIKTLYYLLLVLISGVFIGGCAKTTQETPAPTPPAAILPEPPAADTMLTIDAGFYSVSGRDSTIPKGEILMALNSSTQGKLFFLDQRGSLIREKPLSAKVENLQKWVVGGLVRYTYFQTEGVSSLDGNLGIEEGYEMVCDSNLNIIDSVKLQTFGSINSTVQDKVDVHEFIFLEDKHYICETYYAETPNNIPDSLHPGPGVRVASCIIQETKNGQVIFQWDGAQFPEFYSASQENNNFSDTTTLHDYMHMNAICIDSLDNNLVVSFRNLDEIIKINHQTGQIMWRLGGNKSDFVLTQDQVFLRQHYARKIEQGKTLIFLDNGLDSVRTFSRILEFQLDEGSHTISNFKSFQIPDKFIQFAGSVKKEGNNYFIGGGSANYSLEVNYVTNQSLVRLNLEYPSYRALKY
jgi:arylsulfate sulfotransferase